jgi:two-component sensor histidine kinase
VLRRLPNDHCELLFSDDGSGIQHEQLRSGTSFGMELVRTFAEQLNGTIRLMKGEGTTFELTFRPDERVLRAAS